MPDDITAKSPTSPLDALQIANPPAKPSPYPEWQRARGITTGRPTTYNPAYCDIADSMGSDGQATLYNIAAALNTTHQQVGEWMRLYPEFAVAVQRARSRMADYWLRTYLPLCAGEGKSVAQASMIFHLKNITDWQDTRGVEYSGQVTIKSAASKAFSKHLKEIAQDAIDVEYTVIDDPK